MKNNSLYRIVAPALLLGTLIVLAGCGGDSNNDSDLLGTGGISLPGASRYAGTYRGTLALPEGRTGTTNITVAADGTATGTLTVSGGTTATRQATAFSFGTGTYTISGTVDPTTGAFSMTGNIGGQAFSYSGTLPTPGNGNVGGVYTLTAGGQTYTGSFAGSGGGTVTPTPTPAPTPTPGGTSTGTTSLTFSNVSVAGIDVSPITTASIKADASEAKLFFNYDGVESSVNATITASTGAGALDVRTLTLALSNTGFPAGSAFSVTEPGTIATKAVAVFRQIGFSPYKSVGYGAKSGKVVIVSRSATTITFRLENVTFAGDAINSDDSLTGSFTVNGEFTIALTTPFPP